MRKLSGPSVAIVTPWLGHLELADDYMASVLPELDHVGDELIVVDNATEPPLEFAKLRLQENLGFAGASNVGLEHATAEAVLFLNNDIAARWRGWLQPIRDALEPGVLVGTIRYDAHADVDGKSLPYLDGWCMAGLRADLLEIGGFDPELIEPAYYSDNIICLRARSLGMTLREVPIGLEHKVSRTAQPSSNPQVKIASAANRERYQTIARQLLGLV